MKWIDILRSQESVHILGYKVTGGTLRCRVTMTAEREGQVVDFVEKVRRKVKYEAGCYTALSRALARALIQSDGRNAASSDDDR